MAEAVLSDTMVTGILILIGMAIILLIIREIRLMRTSNRKIELELEKDKLKLLEQHEAHAGFSFTRLSPDQTASIRQVEDENEGLVTTIYAKEKLLEGRLARLENLVKSRKLDNLLAGAEEQERKVK